MSGTRHRADRGGREPHEQWLELAAAAALDTLEPADEPRLEAHLAGCAGCRAEASSFAETAALLAETSVEPAAPPALWQSIAVRLGDQSATPLPPAPPGPPATGRRLGDPAARPSARRVLVHRRAGRALAAAAALVTVAGLGLVGVQALRDDGGGSGGCVASARCRPVALRGPDKALVGTAEVRGDRVRLAVDRLPRNDRGREVYVLWQLTRTGSPRAVDVFDADGASVALAGARLPAPATETTGLALSLEPGRTAPAAPTKVVATGTFAS